MNRTLLASALALTMGLAQADILVGSGSTSSSGSNSNSMSQGGGSSYNRVSSGSSASSTTSSNSSAAGGAGGAGYGVGYGGSATGGSARADGGSASASNGAASAGNTQNITYNTPAANGTSNQTIVRNTGTTRIENTPDVSVFVPGPTVPCFASYGGNVSVPGFGLGLGGGLVDKDCTAREDARTLVSMGLTQEAINRLCQRPDMRNALGSRCPFPVEDRPLAARPQPVTTTAAVSGVRQVSYTDKVARCRTVPDREFAACMRAARQ